MRSCRRCTDAWPCCSAGRAGKPESPPHDAHRELSDCSCSITGPIARAGTNVSAPSSSTVPRSSVMNSTPWVGRVPAPGSRRFFAAKEPAMAITAMTGMKRPNHMAQSRRAERVALVSERPLERENSCARPACDDCRAIIAGPRELAPRPGCKWPPGSPRAALAEYVVRLGPTSRRCLRQSSSGHGQHVRFARYRER